MERTVPQTVNNEIDLYIRTYYSLLRSTGEIAIETLAESHVVTESSLHPDARSDRPDVSALIYTSLRMPACLAATRLVLLGQRSAVFERFGYPVERWQEVAARARRRRAYFNGDETLALYIASRSDIDDIIPTLTAYQIEWNKIHRLLTAPQVRTFLAQLPGDRPLAEDELAALGVALGVTLDDIERLQVVWEDQFLPTLRAMAEKQKRLALRLLAGSLSDYRKAMRHWWLNVREELPEIEFDAQRVYFVSSNTHSIVNMWSGYALRQRETLHTYIMEAGRDDLLAEYQDIEANAVPSSRENFLYYVLKKYLQDAGAEAYARRVAAEGEVGIHRVPSEHGFDMTAQVIEMGKACPDCLDPRLLQPDIDLLGESESLIFNIDYPLGLAAYDLLMRVVENIGEVAGVYVMGKAATLNARIGDVMIPNVVHDEQSLNTYLFTNCFEAADIAPYLAYGTVLDNQKSVTVRGTFLQNVRYMDVFYREGYTDIEMEAGPYLSALYEMIRPKRHPQNEIAVLRGASFDIGIVHYASDTPLGKGQNLGAGSLSYRGMDPTYAAAVAILRRIIGNEIAWLKSHSN